MKRYYVYILLCADGTYYTGITNNVSERLLQHQQGADPSSYTAKRLPVELKYVATFSDVNTAIRHEKQIKNWSKAKKEALIKENWEALKELSRKQFK